MKTSKTSLAAHISAVFVLSGCAAVSLPVYEVPEKNCNDPGSLSCKKFDGIPYVLPRTTLKISLPVSATTTHEGGFFSEVRKVDATTAEKMVDNKCIQHVKAKAEELNLKLFDTTKTKDTTKTEYSLDDVTLTPDAEPDPSKLYYVEVKGGLFERRKLHITYSDMGILDEIHLEKENKAIDFISTTFNSILKIATFGATSGIEDGSKDETFREACDGSKYKDIAERAMSRLGYIKNYSAIRLDLVTGASKGTGIGAFENMELRLHELEKQYDASREIFEGTKQKTTKTYEVTLRPKAKYDAQITVANFNQTRGLCWYPDPSGKMPPTPSGKMPSTPSGMMLATSVPQCQSKPNPDSTPINVVFSSPPQLDQQQSLSSRIDDSLDTVTSKRGIYYRVPEITRVSIKNGDTDLLVKDVPISQYGKIASLPADTGSSNVTYEVTLDPATGMLRNVDITSSAASTTTGQDFIDPIGNYVKSRDELTQLEREEKIWDAKHKIDTHKKALGVE